MGTVTNLPTSNPRRIRVKRDPMAALRGAVADLRACAGEAMHDPDGLLEIARRIDAALNDLEGV